MQLFRKKIMPNGRRHVYLFGMKICSYRWNTQPTWSPPAVDTSWLESDVHLTEDEINEVHRCYQRHIAYLKRKQKRRKIRVAFLVALPHMFSARSLFERMLEDGQFETTLILVPDLRFGDETRQFHERAIEEFKKYGEHLVVSPLNAAEDTINLTDIADIIFCSLPYDISHTKYSLANIMALGIIPAHVPYSMLDSNYMVDVMGANRYSLFWKVFLENQQTFNIYQKCSRNGGKNAVVVGACKMDGLHKYMRSPRQSGRKCVIITAHHTLPNKFHNKDLTLSCFYLYGDLYLSLADKYQEIDFVFRPHPAFRSALEAYWGKERVEAYYNGMRSRSNIFISEESNYHELFVQSDGIINDCGSFLVEYFFTDMPQCYLLKSKDEIKNIFSEVGVECLSHCYQAYCEQDIVDFIENVIVRGDDQMKECRMKYAHNEIRINHPHVANQILKLLKTELS